MKKHVLVWWSHVLYWIPFEFFYCDFTCISSVLHGNSCDFTPSARWVMAIAAISFHQLSVSWQQLWFHSLLSVSWQQLLFHSISSVSHDNSCDFTPSAWWIIAKAVILLHQLSVSCQQLWFHSIRSVHHGNSCDFTPLAHWIMVTAAILLTNLVCQGNYDFVSKVQDLGFLV